MEGQFEFNTPLGVYEIRKSPRYTGLKSANSNKSSRFLRFQVDPVYNFPTLARPNRHLEINKVVYADELNLKGTLQVFEQCSETSVDFKSSHLEVKSTLDSPTPLFDDEEIPFENPGISMPLSPRFSATKSIQFEQKPHVRLVRVPHKILTPSSSETEDEDFLHLPDTHSPIFNKIAIFESSENIVTSPFARLLSSVACSGYLSALPIHRTNDTALHVDTLFSKDIYDWMAMTAVSWVTCGFEHCLLLCTDGRVMSWGFAGSRCTSTEHSTAFPTEIQSLRQKEIVYIEAGAYHNAAISASGDLYTWGRGDVYQLGLPLDSLQEDTMGKFSLLPTKVEYFRKEKVVGVGCGEVHTLVLDSNGFVYSFGWNEDGQLGTLFANSGEIRQLNLPPINSISAGGSVSCAVDCYGKLHVWGSSEFGQLGLGSVELQREPTVVKIEQKVAAAVCGENHCLAVCEEGDVLAWGLDLQSEECYYQPQPIHGVDIVHKVLI